MTWKKPIKCRHGVHEETRECLHEIEGVFMTVEECQCCYALLFPPIG